MTTWTISTDGNTLANARTNVAVEFVAPDKHTHRATQVVAAGARIVGLEFSPSDRLLLIASLKSSNGESQWTVSALNRSTGEQQGPFDGAQGPFAFSPDEGTLVTGGADYAVQVWDLAARRLLANLRKHTWEVTSAAFAPDGKPLITASVDNTIRLWDTATWKEVGVLKGHTGGMQCAVFSTDGKTLVSSGADFAIIMWNVATRRELFNFKSSRDSRAVLCSPDLSVLAVAETKPGQDSGGILPLHAPSFAEIAAKEKAKSAAQIRMPTGD